MEDLNNLDLFTLVDLLAKYTNEYMKMFKEGATDQEFAQCKKMIHNLTAEVEYRKQKTFSAKMQRGLKREIQNSTAKEHKLEHFSFVRFSMRSQL